MASFAEIATSRYATILYDFSFIFALTGIYLVVKKRYLNSFQKYGLYLLMIGVILRILLLTIDYLHMLLSGTHFIKG